MPKLPNPANHNGAVLERSDGRAVPYIQRGAYVYLEPGPEQLALMDEPGDWNHSGEVTIVANGRKRQLHVTGNRGSERSEFQSAMKACGFGDHKVIFV